MGKLIVGLMLSWMALGFLLAIYLNLVFLVDSLLR